MAEAFKNLIGAHTVHEAAQHLQRAWPGFDAARFEALALDGLEALEFKARAMHLCAALEATLPDDFERAAAIVEAALAPPGEGDDLSTLRSGAQGLAGWVVWPLGEFVVRRGADTPQRALQTLHALTQRHTAEWAIRPFIERHPELAFATLARWCKDPSAHVRRLVSEGSRPRLPWGAQLKTLIADPSPTLPLLRALQDDPSEYVRRSVANHLNDIAKDHPQVVVQWLQEFLPGAPPERQRLLKHASRTLIKQGHAPVLQAWGLGRPLRGTARLQLTPKRLHVGEVLTLALTLQSSAARAQPLQIDYAVHHVKASGATSAKVFKGWSLILAPQQTLHLNKAHSMRAVTTRRYHPGRHEVDLRINGQVLAKSHVRTQALIRRAQSAASKPTVMPPSGHCSTGRLIRLGCSSISARAPAASRTASRRASSRRRQVVPWRLSSRSQPALASHWSRPGNGTPAFLKSWKSKATPWPSSQARAFFTVSQLGMPYSVRLAISAPSRAAEAARIAARIDADGTTVAQLAAVQDRHLEPQAFIGRVAPRPDLPALPAAAAHFARPAQRVAQPVAVLALEMRLHVGEGGLVQHLAPEQHLAVGVDIDHPGDAAVGTCGEFDAALPVRPRVAAGRRAHQLLQFGLGLAGADVLRPIGGTAAGGSRQQQGQGNSLEVHGFGLHRVPPAYAAEALTIVRFPTT